LQFKAFAVWASDVSATFDTQDDTQFLGGCKWSNGGFVNQKALIKAKPAKAFRHMAGFEIPNF
jgi:hypothetical protein